MENILLLGMPGGWEMFLIFMAILLIFGGKKIPEICRGLGKGINEFKKAKNEIHDAIVAEEKKDKQEKVATTEEQTEKEG